MEDSARDPRAGAREQIKITFREINNLSLSDLASLNFVNYFLGTNDVTSQDLKDSVFVHQVYLSNVELKNTYWQHKYVP